MSADPDAEAEVEANGDDDLPDDIRLIRRLLARDPKAYVRDDGHVVVPRTCYRPDGETRTWEQDLTRLYRNAPRRTGHVDHLVIEAELAAEGDTVGNPAVPVDDATERAARRGLDARGLEPAWEHPDASAHARRALADRSGGEADP